MTPAECVACLIGITSPKGTYKGTSADHDIELHHARIAELERLLFEEVLHDHDCYSHDGSQPDYDAAWSLFFTKEGSYTPLGALLGGKRA